MTEEEERVKSEEEKPADAMDVERTENTVLIGRKPVMNYVVACLTFFNSGEKTVAIKARGRAISTAVDTVELLRRAFMKGLKITQISIGTEEVQREDRISNVSTIEINVERP